MKDVCATFQQAAVGAWLAGWYFGMQCTARELAVATLGAALRAVVWMKGRGDAVGVAGLGGGCCCGTA